MCHDSDPNVGSPGQFRGVVLARDLVIRFILGTPPNTELLDYPEYMKYSQQCFSTRVLSELRKQVSHIQHRIIW